jgi:hypothetical protein
LDVHRTRELDTQQVATINYVIKKRAVRYVAASPDFLVPETVVGDPRWSEIDNTLHFDGYARKLASRETILSMTTKVSSFQTNLANDS